MRKSLVNSLIHRYIRVNGQYFIELADIARVIFLSGVSNSVSSLVNDYIRYGAVSLHASLRNKA